MLNAFLRGAVRPVLTLLCASSLLTGGAAQAFSRALIDPAHHRVVQALSGNAGAIEERAGRRTAEQGPLPTRVPSSGDISDPSRPRYAAVEGPWAKAVNLSLSGAASDPQIVTASDGRLWVFWWDAFNGLVATSYTPGGASWGETWSPPVVAPITAPRAQGEGETARWALSAVGEMPSVVGAGEYAQAFWLGPPDEETGLQPLLHSRLATDSPLEQGTTEAWSRARVVADAAAVWRLAVAPDDALHLVYARTGHSGAWPAGIYHRRSLDGGASWGQPTVLHEDIYYRRLDPERAHLAVAADREGRVYVTWDDVRLGESLMTASGDGGANWGEAHVVRRSPAQTAEGTEGVHRARVVPTKNDVLRLWEMGGGGSGCSLSQQRLLTMTTGMTMTWSAGRPVLEGLTACPDGPVVLGAAETDPLMIMGTGGETLSAVAWRGAAGLAAEGVEPRPATPGWSRPKVLSIRFQHPELHRPVYLDQLQATVEEGKLAVVGVDQYGDVWYLGSAVDAWEWALAPPPPWTGPVKLSQSAGRPGVPSMVADGAGRLHALWVEGATAGAAGGTLRYARLERGRTPSAVGPRPSSAEELGSRWSPPAQVLESPDGGAMDAALAIHQDRLYAVWVGGQGDALYASHAFVRDASLPTGWGEPIAVPMGGVTASSPAVLVDARGALHVAYAAPLNEGRGIYYLRFDRPRADRAAQGEFGFALMGSRSELRLVFDAQAAGFVAVDRPQLALDGAGTLHVVWVRGLGGSPFPPQAVLYARSADGGLTWSDPRVLAEGGCDWPLLAVPRAGEVHVLWNEVNDGNAWSHRWSLDSGQTWTYPQQVRGFGQVPGPAGLAADGAGDLYLVGLRRGERHAPALVSAMWRWEQERWEEQAPFRVAGVRDPLPGVAVALRSGRGRLDAAFRAWMPGEGEDYPDVLHAQRTVPVVAEAPAPDGAPVPTATPTDSPTARPTGASRPAVEVAPPQAGPPAVGLGPVALPLAALGGIGLALIIVVGVLLTRGRR